ncbi:MAG: arsenate reductase (thioredoxin) [Limnochordia bacterium]|jgi:arsenate reductase
MRIMFLCTGNSCRSQMAEGIAKAIGKDHEIYSAGLEAQGLNPLAVEVMAEIGIDISSQTSDILDQSTLASMDCVITLCGDAHERCPLLPAQIKRYHWPFPDPAQAQGSREEILEEFRRVRDLIYRRIDEFLQTGE